MSRLIIGPSTGWLYAIGVNSLMEQQAILENAGADAVEFCIGASLEPTDVRVASMLDAKDRPFAIRYYRSLHLPDYNPDVESVTQAKMAMRIAASQVASTMLIHPLKINGDYPIGYYDQLSSAGQQGAGVRFAIENMDKNKPDGFLLRELETLAQYCDLKFVLDVQHAFEHDSSMQYARDLFSAMRGRLVHLHVSGEAECNNHCLLHRARNIKPLVEFLGEIFASLGDQPCPIILEGEYRTAEDLVAEIAFIRKEVGANVVCRQALVERRRKLIDEMCFSHPAQIATNLGPASDGEYQAYLTRYERMREELAVLNKQLGLSEYSTALIDD